MGINGPPGGNNYLGRVLDNLQSSVDGVGRKLDDLTVRVEVVRGEQTKLREEMTMRQARAFDTAMEMLPKLGLMRWDAKEAEALRTMVARELAGKIMRRQAEEDVAWWNTRIGKLLVVLGVLALLATIAGFTLTAYNAFFGVSHPLGGGQ